MDPRGHAARFFFVSTPRRLPFVEEVLTLPRQPNFARIWSEVFCVRSPAAAIPQDRRQVSSFSEFSRRQRVRAGMIGGYS